MYQTLHCHTTTSDGQLTHQQILDLSAQNNISVVAFTDHDSLPNGQSLEYLLNNKDHQTKWVLGIEISSGMPKEIGGPASNFHVVGLFVNPTNKKLKDYCQKAQAARIERMERMVKNLQGLGFAITEDDCLKASGGEAVARPHIVKALLSKEENLKVIEKIRVKMAKDSENNAELKEKYDQMMELGLEKYPYNMFLTGDSYIQGVYVDYLYYLDMDSSVALIRQAEGIASIAHPTFSKKKVPLEMVGNFLKDNRLDGAETVYGLNFIGTEREEEFAEDRKIIKDYVDKYKKAATGGVDLHKEQDLIDFANSGQYAQETVGMVEKVLERTGVSKEWSSLG